MSTAGAVARLRHRLLEMGEEARGLRNPVAIVAALVALATLLLWPAVAAARTPEIQAHRGGTLETIAGKQVPKRPEETVATFRRAAKRGYAIELDVKLTSDGVPVTMHDATLDRTTDCEGEVAAISWKQLRRKCEVDLLGTEDNDKPMGRHDPLRAPVPKLRHVLRMAKHNHARINLEIKNIPTEPDYDPTSAYAERVAGVIKRSGFPVRRLIVQSFWPPNLDVIKADPYFSKATTSFLTLSSVNDAAPPYAAEHGYDWVSPQWPVDANYIAGAHDLGLRIVPFTIDTPHDLRKAGGSGIEALITNDPDLARKILKSA